MGQKLVDFNNPLMRTLLAKNLQIRERDVKRFVLPSVSDTITLGNIIYRITYVRENPFRFTAEPIGIVEDEAFVKEMEEVNKKLNPTSFKVEDNPKDDSAPQTNQANLSE